MKINDTLSGLVLLALAAFIFIYARLLPPMPGQAYGAGAFPTLVAGGLGLFSFLLILGGLAEGRRQRRPWIERTGWARDRQAVGNVGLALLAIVLYLLAADFVGFIPLAIAILTTLFLRLGVAVRRAIGIAVIASLAMHGLFANLLRIPLPRGLLTDILW